MKIIPGFPYCHHPVIESLEQLVFIKFRVIISLKMKRELSCGAIYKVKPEPNTAPRLGIDQGRIWVAEVNLPELMIHHSRKKFRGLCRAI